MESVKYTRTCVRQNFVIYIQNKQNKHIHSEIALLLSELKWISLFAYHRVDKGRSTMWPTLELTENPQ